MAAADQVRTVVESFQALLEGHIRLFKLELAEDAKVIGIEVGKIVVFLPLILVGYAFLCAALAMFLSGYMGLGLSTLVVGLLNVVGGALGIALAAMKLKNKTLLEGTRREVAATTSAISHAVRDPAVTIEVTRG